MQPTRWHDSNIKTHPCICRPQVLAQIRHVSLIMAAIWRRKMSITQLKHSYYLRDPCYEYNFIHEHTTSIWLVSGTSWSPLRLWQCGILILDTEIFYAINKLPQCIKCARYSCVVFIYCSSMSMMSNLHLQLFWWNVQQACTKSKQSLLSGRNCDTSPYKYAQNAAKQRYRQCKHCIA